MLSDEMREEPFRTAILLGRAAFCHLLVVGFLLLLSPAAFGGSDRPEMNATEFWNLIDQSKQFAGGDIELQSELLRVSLLKLSEPELVAFEGHYRDALDAAHHWDLWAAAYILNGGCSDDCFEYFKDWLISQGNTVYRDALRDPESLASVAKPYAVEAEHFRYVAREAFEEKFKKAPPFGVHSYSRIRGQEWGEETVADKFKKLSALVRG